MSYLWNCPLLFLNCFQCLVECIIQPTVGCFLCVFVFSNCRFCRTSELSSWVDISILQAYQLLSKYHCYIFLYSDCNSKCFKKILTGKLLQKLYLILANTEVCCWDPPQTSFRFNTLLPPLLRILLTAQSWFIPQLKRAALQRPRPQLLSQGCSRIQ